MLLGNYSVLLKSPSTWLAGNSTAGNAHAKARSNFSTPGQFRSGTMQDGSGNAGTNTAKSLVSIPTGYGMTGWRVPTTAGGISSTNNAQITLGGTGLGEMGVPIGGASSITFNLVGTGGLIVTASGSAGVVLGAAGSLFASLSTTGTAGITLSAAGSLYATGSVLAVGTFTINGGTSTIIGIGTIAGTTADSGVLTAPGIATAVWQYLIGATEARNLLAGAGAAGDPWIATLPGAYGAGTAGNIVGNLLASIGARLIENGMTQDEVTRIMFAAVAGERQGSGTPTVTFLSQDGLKTRISLTHVNGNGDPVIDGS